MLTEIRVYYEGHGLLMPGFSQFFEQLRGRARQRGCAFRLVAGGSGAAACRDFGRALKSHPHSWNILLKDSEGPDTGSISEALAWSMAGLDLNRIRSSGWWR